MTPQTRVVVLVREGCHLCDEAVAVVEAVCTERAVGWEARDLDAIGGDLLAQWSDAVPVTLVDGAVHDYWRVDPERLRTALAG